MQRAIFWQCCQTTSNLLCHQMLFMAIHWRAHQFLKAWQEFVRTHSEQQRDMRSALTNEQATTLAMSEALILAAADKRVEKVTPFAHHWALKDMIRAVFRAHYKTPIRALDLHCVGPQGARALLMNVCSCGYAVLHRLALLCCRLLPLWPPRLQ